MNPWPLGPEPSAIPNFATPRLICLNIIYYHSEKSKCLINYFCKIKFTFPLLFLFLYSIINSDLCGKGETMQKVNYQLIFEKELQLISRSGKKPRLLLHICCAPCSSYVLEYLSEYFDITLFFYNPNITSENEYNYRIDEAKRLIAEMPLTGKVDFIPARYDISEFFAIAKGFENEPEG